MTELRVLGPVEMIHGGRPVDLGPPQRRLVLAALAVDAGRPVSVSTLLDRVWDEPPDGAARAVYAHVARLRRALDAAAPDKVTLRRAPGGYLLDAPPDWVDVHRFEDLVRAAMDDLLPPRERAGLLRRALELWRGAPLGGSGTAWAVRTRARWRERRAEAVVRWARIERELGGADEAIALLRAELAEQPHGEAIAVELMRALDAAGRGAEALRVYSTIREQLIDELGAEPGAALREVHLEILRGEPAAPVPPAQLPPAGPLFAGRGAELALLDAWLDGCGDDRSTHVMAITGVGGVGKTTLAVRWASRVAGRFAGQLYVDLRGWSNEPPRRPIDVLAGFLRALGGPGEQVPADEDEAAARYRSALAGRPMLVLLDNATGAAQVRPLLPGPGSVVLVTGRERMPDLVVAHGAGQLTLDALDRAAAVDLLTALLGAARAGTEPAAVAELARLCGRLPLALRVAGANLLNRPRVSVAEHVAELAGGDRIGALAVPGAAGSAVRRTFDLSYRALDEPARRLFRRLGLVPGADVDVAAAAALLGAARPQTRRLLDRLATAHLVEEVVLGRFALHDLLRLYAGQRAAEEPAAERDAALVRLLEHYLDRVRAAAARLYPQMPQPPLAPPPAGEPFTDRPTARAWLDAELPNLVAAVEYGAAHGVHRHSWWLAYALRGYFDLCRDAPTWERAARAARAAAERDGDPAALAATEHNLAHLAFSLSKWDAAIDRLTIAQAHAERAGWTAGQRAMLAALGATCLETGRRDLGERHLLAALDLARATGDTTGEANCLDNLAVVYAHGARPDRAADRYRQALAAYRRAGSDSGAGHALTGLAECARLRGRFNLSAGLVRRALGSYGRVGNSAGRVYAWYVLSALHADRGRTGAAVRCAAAALRLAHRAHDAHGEASARNALGVALRRRGRLREAAAQHRRAARLAARMHLPYLRAEALLGLAATTRDRAAAARHRAAAQAIAHTYDFHLQPPPGPAPSTPATPHPRRPAHPRPGRRPSRRRPSGRRPVSI